MNTQHISPRMLEAGISAYWLWSVEQGPAETDEEAAALVEAIYLAMRAKLVESLEGCRPNIIMVQIMENARGPIGRGGE